MSDWDEAVRLFAWVEGLQTQDYTTQHRPPEKSVK